MEKYLFGLEFHAEIISENGAMNVKHTTTDYTKFLRGDFTATISMAKFFRKQKWEDVSMKRLSSLEGFWPPTLRYGVYPGNMVVHVQTRP